MPFVSFDEPKGGIVDFDAPAPLEPEGGFTASAKSAVGAALKGAGQAAGDFIYGVDQDNALKRYGQEVIDANPTAVQSMGDIAEKPWTAVKEAAGNAGGSLGQMLGARALGTGITALSPLTGPAAPLTALVGQAISWFGPAAVAALPSYGGIRDKQILNDPANNDDAKSKAIAALGAATVGAIETKFGPQEWALSAMTKEGRTALAKKFAATTFGKSVAIAAGKGALIEGAEELVQNPVEQLASYDDPTTAESMQDTAFGGAMGAIGGGVLGGGHGGLFHQRKAVDTQPPPAIIDATTVDDAINAADAEVSAAISNVGQQWQALDTQSLTDLDLAQLEAEQAGARNARATDARIADLGQQWQALGIEDPATLLQRQRVGFETQETANVSQNADLPAVDSGAAGVGGIESGISLGNELGVGSVVEPTVDAGGEGALPTGGTAPLGAQQPAKLNTEPTSTWFGRRGDGYQTEADAAVALPTRQKVAPELQWKIEQMPSGRYRLAGYGAAGTSVKQSEFIAIKNPTGTATVYGDTTAIKAQLTGAGIDKMIVGNGKVTVAVPQAQAAIDIIRAGQPQAASVDAQVDAASPSSADVSIPRSVDAMGKPASWVIRNKESGEVLFETFDAAKVGALNTAKYEAVPIGDYLGSINGQQKAPASVGAGAPMPTQGAPVLQNRNRATPSSITQMQSIAANPDYGRLGFSRDFANGAPVVAGGEVAPAQMGRSDVAVASNGRRIPVQYAVVEADDVLASNNVDGSPNEGYGNQAVQRIRAIAGNGRIAGLQAAYGRGTGQNYINELTADNLHGVSQDVIRGMRAPVLVRVMPNDQITSDIGDLSNTASNLDLSAVEQANNDARRVNLDALQFSEDGGITAEAVRQFVRAMPQTEQGGLIDTNGQPTKQAVDRISAAVFAKAYGNDQLVRLFAQAQDPEARIILSALAQVAPKMARLEGAGALDIRGVVTQAAEIAVNARREGKRLALAAQQLDMAADPDVAVVLDLFAANSRSVKTVVEALTKAADFSYTEATKPSNDMFGEVPRASRADVFNQLSPQNEQRSQENLEDAAGSGPAQVNVGRAEAGPRANEDAGAIEAGRPAKVEELLAAPSEADVLAQQGRRDNAKALDDKAQIDREASGQTLTNPTAPEQRKDTTGDLLGGPSTEDALAERRRKEAAKAKPADDGTGPLFSRTGKEDPRDLIIQHNLTAENLLHAERMGGIPVPSLAITKAAQPLENFGEITLLGDVDMATPKGDMKVFGADIYSPRYPNVQYKPDNASLKRIKAVLEPFRNDGEYSLSELRTLDDLTGDKAFVRYADSKAGGTASYAQLKSEATKLARESGAEEQIFQGFTYSGNRKYKAHTLDNVIAILKKELRGGENFNYGAGSLRAKFTPQFRTIKAIRNSKDRLITTEAFEVVKDEINKELLDLSYDMVPNGGFRSSDTGMAILEDGARMGLRRAAKEYDIELSDEQVERANEFLQKLRNLPTAYFEAKALRAMDLSEFKVAVVPDNLDADARRALEKRGVKIVTYEKGNAEARTKAIADASAENGLMFSRASEGIITRMAQTQAQAAVDAITAKWKSGPKVKVVNTYLDLPVKAPRDVKGMYYKGVAYVVALRHRSAQDVGRTLAHEVIAHHGLRNMLGRDDWMKLMKQVQFAIKAGNKPLNALRDTVRERYVNEDGTYTLSPNIEADEIIALGIESAIDENGEFKPGYGMFKAVWAKIATFLRDMGINIKFTNAELQGMLVLAQRELETGKKAEGGGEVLVAASRGEDAQASRGTNEPVTKSNDVVGNQGGGLAISRLNKVMRESGWEIEYVDMDLTAEKPTANIRINRDDGRFLIAKVDSIGRGTMETFQRERGLRMDPGQRGRRPLSPMVDDVFLGRQKFEGARAMLRGMTNYLADNATNPVALSDMRSAWASVMSVPVRQDAHQLSAPTNDGAPEPVDQTDTPEFKAWFKGSKVVDADGKPLRVYHGTSKDTNFSKINVGPRGAWFTSDSEIASEYAEENDSKKLKIDRITGKYVDVNAASRVLPVFLKIENPYTLTQEDKFRVNVTNYAKGQRELFAEIKAKGYDGILWNNNLNKEWVVLGGPEQIKSAIGNNGQFDPNDPDIRFSRTGIVGQTNRQHTPEQLRAMKNVGFQVELPTLKERAQALWKDAGKTLAQGLADQFDPVKELGGNAYTLLRLAKGASGAFEAFLQGGQLKLTDKVYDFDDAKKGGVVDRLLIPLQGEHHDFMRWIAANRAERLKTQGKENLFSAQDIADLKTLATGTTDFDYTIKTGPQAGQVTRDRMRIYADSQRVFNEFNKNILDLAEESGLIDGEARKLWEHEFYVPFYRVADESNMIAGANIKGGVVRQQAFKALKGGKNALNADLLDNTLMNWAHLLDAAAKNRAAKATLDTMENLGKAVNAPEHVVREMGTSVGNKDGVVWYMDDGMKRFFLVDDKHLLAAISSLEYAGMRNPVMNAMGAMKHALTVGVTASPFFKIRNLIRDSVQVLGTSEISANPFANVAKGWKLTDQKSDAYFRLLAGGGTIHFGTMYEGSEAKRVQALVESGISAGSILDSDKKVKAFYRQFIEPAVTAYNEMGNRGEAINRAALYDQLVKGGMGHAEASLQARDLMDFSMQGTFTSIRFLTQTVPFLNARIQGLYKLGRAAKEDPARFSAVIGSVAMVSLGLLAAYHDDDDWKKREEWDRNNFWWFKFGGQAFRIPKPFEIGAMATLAERGFELAFDKEMTNKRFMGQVRTLLGDNLSMNPIPQLVKPILDVYSNKDSFSGRPIETMSMERLQPEYRFNGRTTMAARAASTGMNAAARMLGGEALSPVQIDHMLRGYFGWLGSFIVGAGDVIARPMTDQPKQATPDYWKMATGSIVSDTRNAPSRYVSQMYEQAKEIEQAYGTYRALVKEGKMEEAKAFMEDNRDELKKHGVVAGVKRAQSKLNERRRMIERSNLQPEEKRELLQQISQQQDRIARVVAP